MKFYKKKTKLRHRNRSINESKGITDLKEEPFAKKAVRIAFAIRENSHLVLLCPTAEHFAFKI